MLRAAKKGKKEEKKAKSGERRKIGRGVEQEGNEKKTDIEERGEGKETRNCVSRGKMVTAVCRRMVSTLHSKI